jgi:adenylyl- and sulfurtransferase ThiI
VIRLKLFELSSQLHSEGLASLFEFWYAEQISFDESEYNQKYNEAYAYAKKIRKLFAIFVKAKNIFKFNSKEFEEEFSETTYNAACSVGFHICLTLITIGKASLKSLLNISHYQFLKKYEECMNKIVVRPIISLNSGKGVIDYNKILKTWNKLDKKIVKIE